MLTTPCRPLEDLPCDPESPLCCPPMSAFLRRHGPMVMLFPLSVSGSAFPFANVSYCPDMDVSPFHFAPVWFYSPPSSAVRFFQSLFSFLSSYIPLCSALRRSPTLLYFTRPLSALAVVLYLFPLSMTCPPLSSYALLPAAASGRPRCHCGPCY